MKLSSLLFILSLGIALVCCIPEEEPDPIVLASGTHPEDYDMDFYWIEDVTIEADTLFFSVSYSGGCREHEFALVAWSYFMESYPVQAGLLLSHNSHGDPCEAHIFEEMEFDLTPLKEEYQAAYHEETGTIILRILLPETAYEYLSVWYDF